MMERTTTTTGRFISQDDGADLNYFGLGVGGTIGQMRTKATPGAETVAQSFSAGNPSVLVR